MESSEAIFNWKKRSGQLRWPIGLVSNLKNNFVLLHLGKLIDGPRRAMSKFVFD